MIKTQPTLRPSPIWCRLSALGDLTTNDRLRLQAAERDRTVIRSHRDILQERERIRTPYMLADGWAFRSHLVPSGQRQILSFVLPGELIGVCTRRDPIAASATTTLTKVVVCPAPLPDTDPQSGLTQAYAVSAALEEAHLCRQITRLGRMSAYERIADWLLEMHDRLTLAGIADAQGFAFPLTQELIADALGLTSVHVNRMIRALRESGMVTIGARHVTIHDRKRMEQLVCYQPAKVVA